MFLLVLTGPHRNHSVHSIEEEVDRGRGRLDALIHEVNVERMEIIAIEKTVTTALQQVEGVSASVSPVQHGSRKTSFIALLFSNSEKRIVRSCVVPVAFQEYVDVVKRINDKFEALHELLNRRKEELLRRTQDERLLESELL